MNCKGILVVSEPIIRDMGLSLGAAKEVEVNQRTRVGPVGPGYALFVNGDQSHVEEGKAVTGGHESGSKSIRQGAGRHSED